VRTPLRCAKSVPDVLGDARVIEVDQVGATLAEVGDLIQAIDRGRFRLTDFVSWARCCRRRLEVRATA